MGYARHLTIEYIELGYGIIFWCCLEVFYVSYRFEDQMIMTHNSSLYVRVRYSES